MSRLFSLQQRRFRISPFHHRMPLLTHGSDTTSATLVWVFYYLTINPSIKSALLAELTPVFGSTIPGEFSDPDLSQLPYLKAVIDETLRIKPVSGNNSPRLTPPEGIVVDGTWIPGNCHVFTPPWSILRHEKYFVQAQEFIPERWTTRPELVKDRRAFIPFNTGRLQSSRFSSCSRLGNIEKLTLLNRPLELCG